MSFRLPRLPEDAEIVTANRRPSFRFQRWWQSIVTKLEGQENTQDDILAQLQQAQADIVTALNQAGIALDLAGAIMPDIPPVTVVADYTGEVLEGQLPRNFPAQRFSGDDNVTTDADWSATLLSGDATFTIGANTGVLNLTALGASSVIEITSEYDDIPRSRRLLITKQLQDPPPSSGTVIEYDTSITASTGSSYGSANAGPLTITCGASGEITLAAPLTFQAYETATGTYTCTGKWQISDAGAETWSDVGSEQTPSVDCTIVENVSFTDGNIQITRTASGLTPSNDYDVRLLLKSGGAYTIYYTAHYGGASATTS